jgi:uncharacterized protein YecE (DUF72 family)
LFHVYFLKTRSWDMLKPKIKISALEWRQKRQARREKQRQQNVGRARKMHEARIAGQPSVPNTTGLETDGPERRYHIGCSGWFYWHWRGLFYPDNIPTSKWFDHYAKRFGTVELNAPFYSWPTVATVNSWVRQLGRRKFIYTVKVCELITHVKRFRGTRELIRDFGYIADLLGPRFGCFLFQLPPSFHYTPARLKLILGQLDHSRRNVVEFRHSSWWNDQVYAAFTRTGTIFCSCSGPKLPNLLIKTANDIYIRFHGVKQWYRHDYTNEELADWTEKIKESEAKRVWAYFNNDREGCALKNARQLRRLLVN